MHNRYTQQIEDIKSENSSLHGTIEDLRNDIIDKNAQISELNGSIEQYKDSLRGMMDLEDKVAVLKEQVTGLSSEKTIAEPSCARDHKIRSKSRRPEIGFETQ